MLVRVVRKYPGYTQAMIQALPFTHDLRGPSEAKPKLFRINGLKARREHKLRERARAILAHPETFSMQSERYVGDRRAGVSGTSWALSGVVVVGCAWLNLEVGLKVGVVLAIALGLLQLLRYHIALVVVLTKDSMRVDQPLDWTQLDQWWKQWLWITERGSWSIGFADIVGLEAVTQYRHHPMDFGSSMERRDPWKKSWLRITVREDSGDHTTRLVPLKHHRKSDDEYAATIGAWMEAHGFIVPVYSCAMLDRFSSPPTEVVPRELRDYLL